MFDDQARREIDRIANQYGWSAAALLAVAEVESGGRAFAVVNGHNEPLIRWEGHYFDRRLSGAKRAQARKAELASPTAGSIPNPSTQAGRWKLFERAAAIDRQAAIESVSWGVGQVMGAHWEWLGYSSAEELMLDARGGVAGQVQLMAKFISKSGLAAALAKHDWAAFAKGYNGSAYAKNSYDKKMAAAYARYGGVAKPNPTTRLQERLIVHGFPLVVDGVSGPKTIAAVRAFQQASGLAVDGIAGPATWAALDSAPVRSVEPPAASPQPLPHTETPKQPSGWLAALVNFIAKLFGKGD